MSVALIDIGAGNLHSVENALRAAGADAVTIADRPEQLRDAERIVLPGVGAFGACAGALRAIPGMVEALEKAALRQARPFLGVCVGMQLMAERSEELGEHAGLGWIAGAVRRLPSGAGVKVPHMGWNDVRPAADHPLLPTGEAYFLHSYAFTGDAVLATTEHGGPVTAAIGRDNLLGVQFHPEKSQRYGIALLERFLAWRP